MGITKDRIYERILGSTEEFRKYERIWEVQRKSGSTKEFGKYRRSSENTKALQGTEDL